MVSMCVRGLAYHLKVHSKLQASNQELSIDTAAIVSFSQHQPCEGQEKVPRGIEDYVLYKCKCLPLEAAVPVRSGWPQTKHLSGFIQ